MAAKKKFLSIVTPTYNEAKNIDKLVKRVHAAMGDRPYELVVVDDNSPDKTWELVEKLSQKYPVRVLRRIGKKGLASAVMDGFDIAKGNLICVIDADLSHPPELLPKMLDAQDKMNADIVVGSRMVKGGGVEGWPNSRKLTSRVASMLALPLTRIKDPMSGYYMFKKDILKGAKLVPRGYKILLEMLVKCRFKKAVEVPFIFRDRTAGTSKLNLKTNLQYLRQLMNLYKHKFLWD